MGHHIRTIGRLGDRTLAGNWPLRGVLTRAMPAAPRPGLVVFIDIWCAGTTGVPAPAPVLLVKGAVDSRLAVNDRRQRVLLRTASASEAASGTDGGETPTGARFGELLVDEALITPDQLTEALRVQRTLANYTPLGEVLMMRGWLTRTQLTSLLRRHRKRARLGDLLVRAKRITPEQLQTALARQQQVRQPLGRTLMALGYVTEITMREALCAQMQVNFFDLDHVSLDPALATVVNEKYAFRRRVVPILRAEGTLVVAVDDPTDVTIVEDLQQLARLRVEIVTSTAARIQRALTRLYRGGPGPDVDPRQHPSIMIGAVHDPEVADLAARVLKVKVLPPYWQAS
jgi:hypothetical protein